MAQIGSYPAKTTLDGTEELVAVQGLSTYKLTPEELRKYGILFGTVVKTLGNSDADFSTFDEFYSWLTGNKFSNTTVKLQVEKGTFSVEDAIGYQFGPKGINELIIAGRNVDDSILEVDFTHEDDFFIYGNNAKITFKNITIQNVGTPSTSFINLKNMEVSFDGCLIDKFDTAIYADESSVVESSQSTFITPDAGTNNALMVLDGKSHANITNGTLYRSVTDATGIGVLITNSSTLYTDNMTIINFFIGLKVTNDGRAILSDMDAIEYEGNPTTEYPKRNIIQPRGEFISDGSANLEYAKTFYPEDALILELTITQSNQQVEAYFNYDNDSAPVDAFIDWGNGYTTTVTYGDADPVGHKYEKVGVYEIKVMGSAQYFYVSNLDSTYTKITDIKQWGDFKVSSAENMFYDCGELTHVTANDGWDLSTASELQEMFLDCDNIKSINVTNWNVSNISSMKYLFRYCYELETVTGLETWDTGNVRTMYGMFYDCYKLKNLDVSNFNTSNVRTFYNMFYECYELEYLDVSNWDVSNCTSFDSTFQNCYKLKDLNVSNWDVSKSKSFSSMFTNSYNVNPDVSNWQFTENDNVTTSIDFSHMFQNATSANPDISGWNIKNAGSFTSFLDGSAFSTENYDKMLIAWSQQANIPSSRTFDCRDTKYTGSNSAVQTARDTLVNTYGWIINDAGSI